MAQAQSPRLKSFSEQSLLPAPQPGSHLREQGLGVGSPWGVPLALRWEGLGAPLRRCQRNCHPAVGAGAGIPLADSPQPACASAQAGAICEGVALSEGVPGTRGAGAKGPQAAGGRFAHGVLRSPQTPAPSCLPPTPSPDISVKHRAPTFQHEEP